jgi:hypothetical protein
MSAPKSDAATIEARKNRLLELLTEGKTQTEAAEQLRLEGFPADLRTVQRDVALFKPQWVGQNKDAVQVYRQQQLDECEADRNELRELKARLVDNLIGPEETIELALKILDRRDKVARREMDLVGTAAPSKHITARVDAENLVKGFYVEFARRTMKLKHPESWQRLWDFIESMPDDYAEEDHLLLEAKQ